MLEKFKTAKAYSNPVDYFNREVTFSELLSLLTKKGEPIFSERNGKHYDNYSESVKKPAELKEIEPGKAILTEKNSLNLPDNTPLSFFEIFTQARFADNWSGAANYIHMEVMKKAIPFICVGGDYYRILRRKNTFGSISEKIKPIKKEEIKEEFGKNAIKLIPRFSDYINEPDNTEQFQHVHGECYNVYNKVHYTPKKGEYPHIQMMMEHIFGEQTELGYRYLQCLYLFPKQILPIICLVSEKRDTGKTTFMDFLQMWLGDNCVPLDPKALTSQFNSIYSNKLVILIDETMLEKQSAIERLKAIATQKTISVNQKFTAEYVVDFYGKVVIASNAVKKFMRIDSEEIRFWVREIQAPKRKVTDILKKMQTEIPALLQYLNTLPAPDFTKSRMVFTKEEIRTSALDAVVKESKSGLCKELEIFIANHFEEYENLAEFHASPKDIKDKWFAHNNQISMHYIKGVLLDEMKVPKEIESTRYSPFGIPLDLQKRNWPFKFERKDFVQSWSVEKAEKDEKDEDCPF